MNTGRQVRIDTCLQSLLYFFTDKVSLTPPLASGGGRLFLEQEAVKKMATGNRFFPELSRVFRMVLALSLFIFLLGVALGYGVWQESPEEAESMLGVFIEAFQELADRMEGTNLFVQARSEERRVGKECRYRWSRGD